MFMEEQHGDRVNVKRTASSSTPAQAPSAACPFCMIMIGNAKDELGVATQPFDVLELARRSMG